MYFNGFILFKDLSVLTPSLGQLLVLAYCEKSQELFMVLAPTPMNETCCGWFQKETAGAILLQSRTDLTCELIILTETGTHGLTELTT
jgi:hypothetical protein